MEIKLSTSKSGFLIAAVALIAIIVVLPRTGLFNNFERTFDSRLWMGDDYDTRGQMLCDLLAITPDAWKTTSRLGENLHHEKSKLWGMTQTEVYLQLGPPEEKRTVDGAMEFTYAVGDLHVPAMVLGYFELKIRFDKAENIASVTLQR